MQRLHPLRIIVFLFLISLPALNATPEEKAPEPQDWTVTGRAVDESGQPVAEGKIEISFKRLDRSFTRSIKSDFSNEFLVQVPERQQYEITIDVPGWAKYRANISAKDAKPGEKRLDLGVVTLQPERIVRGRVLDPAGEPVARAVVSISSQRATRTNAEGRFAVRGLSREEDYEIWIRRHTFEDVKEPLPSFDPRSPDTELEYTPVPLPTIRGVLVDDEGKPVEKAEIHAGRLLQEAKSDRQKPYESFDESERGESKADGSFEVFGPSGLWNLKIEHPDFTQHHLYHLTLEKGTLDLGKIELDRGLELKARVVDAENQPISGVDIALFHYRGSDRPFKPNLELRTDREGRFQARKLPRDDKILLELQHPDYIPEQTRISAIDEEIEIALEQGAEISGVVVDEQGQAISDVTLEARHRSSEGFWTYTRKPIQRHSDRSGRFTFRGLAAGNHHIRAEAEGFSTRLLEPLPVTDNAHIENLQIVLVDHTEIKGQVLDADGEGVEGARIQLYQRFGSSLDRLIDVISDASGRYHISEAPTGAAELSAFHDDLGRADLVVALKPGSQTHDLQFKEPTKNNFSLRVLTSEAHDFQRDRVYLTNVETPSFDLHRFQLDATGHLEARLEPGPYELAILSPVLEHYIHPVLISIDDDLEPPLEIRLSRGATVLVEVHGLDPTQLKELRVGTSIPYNTRGSSTGQGGLRVGPNQYRIGGLSPGAWTIEAVLGFQDRRIEKETITIASINDEQAIELTFEDGFTLKGQLLRNGAPASQGRVHISRANMADRSIPVEFEGRFQFTGLAEGTYSLSVEFGQAARSIRHRYGEIEVPSADLVIDLRAFDLSGRVVGPDGTPVENANLTVEPRHTQTLTTSTSLGTFLFSALPPDHYLVRVFKENHAPELVEVDLTDRSIEDLEIVIKSSSPLSLQVQLLDGLEGSVSICHIDGQTRPLQCESHTVTEGSIELGSFSAQTEWLMLNTEGSGIVFVEVETARSRPILLQRPAILEMEIPALKDRPILAGWQLISPGGFDLFSLGRSSRSPAMAYQFLDLIPRLSPGTWRYRFIAEDGRIFEGSVDLVAGETTKVVVE